MTFEEVTDAAFGALTAHMQSEDLAWLGESIYFVARDERGPDVLARHDYERGLFRVRVDVLRALKPNPTRAELPA
jgi:hypothetical protein